MTQKYVSRDIECGKTWAQAASRRKQKHLFALYTRQRCEDVKRQHQDAPKCFSRASPAKSQTQLPWRWQKLANFSFNSPVFLTIMQHVFTGSNQTLIILDNLLFVLLSLRQASTIFKENPSSQQHPSGLLQSLYSWNKQSYWGGGREKMT